jgi:hypothetical protein
MPGLGWVSLRRRREICGEAVAMSGTGQGTRRVWRGRRAVAIWAAALAVVVTAVATVAAATNGPVRSTPASRGAVRTLIRATAGISLAGRASASGPLTDVSATPAGWAPVPFANAQLSVPGSWLVQSPQQFFCGFSSTGGMIFAGILPGIPKGGDCGLTASLAWIVPAGPLPKGIRHRRPTAVIHGIAVFGLPASKGSVLYLVPELGVRIGARGPLARRVLGTLTRSPLSVVLKRGPAAPVPTGWAWRQFGGLRFATPRSWGPQREDQWSTCGTGLVPGTLLLVDAVKAAMALPCPYPIPDATAIAAQPGLTVVTGKYAAQSVGQNYASCQLRRGVRTCLSTVTGQGGFLGAVLIFAVSRPQHATTYFLLGLSGSGASARAVFTSIMPA